MGKVIISEETTRYPLTKIGIAAGVCWGGDTADKEKNIKRAKGCILSGHGRTLEYVDVEMVIDGYSARVMREFERHVAGAPTFLQSSTRYVDAKNFTYVTPPKLNDEQKQIYQDCMKSIAEAYGKLDELGVPREDCGMLLPLGMTTKIVDKRNLRNLIEMSHQRLCSRAYWEYRLLMKDICTALSGLSDEWKWIIDNCFMPKCDVSGFCNEAHGCGRKAKKE